MPNYNYMCDEDCSVGDYLACDADGLHIFIDPKAKDFRDEPLVWEVIHGMLESPDVSCPVCSQGASKSMMGHKGNFHFRGDYMKNVKECKALSNLHTLEHNDPYAHMREVGEADEKAIEIKKQMKKDYKGPVLDTKPKPLPTLRGKKNTTLQ